MTQPLTLIGHVPLPAHTGSGGFDHAAVHANTGHVYVAHTANSAVDVFDPATCKHLYSIPGLTAVAGALVNDESQLVFTSNRGENTIGVFAPGADPKVTKIAVGLRPNGLAHDSKRGLVLVASAIAVLATATGGSAITNGQPDGDDHPYVGLAVFDVLNAQGQQVPSHRCSASLLSPTLVLTAGHCTDGTVAARVGCPTCTSARAIRPPAVSSCSARPSRASPTSCCAGRLSVSSRLRSIVALCWLLCRVGAAPARGS